VTRDRFLAVLERARAGWAAGDAAAVADCFAEDVDYLDPYRYRFPRRVDLLPFFEPPRGLDLARCYVSDPFGNRIELVDSGDASFSTRDHAARAARS
jgi:hypothetical protein